MNVVKLQQDFIKWKSKGEPIMLCDTLLNNINVHGLCSKYAVYYLLDDEMWINYNIGRTVPDFSEKQDLTSYKDAEITLIFEHKFCNKKMKLIELKNEYTTVYVNKEFLKYFDLSEVEFKIKSDVSFVCVYENHVLRALVLPFKKQ